MRASTDEHLLTCKKKKPPILTILPPSASPFNPCSAGIFRKHHLWYGNMRCCRRGQVACSSIGAARGLKGSLSAVATRVERVRFARIAKVGNNKLRITAKLIRSLCIVL